MDFESRLGTTFNQANTKRPEEITLREDVSSRRVPLLEAEDDFGGRCFFCCQSLYMGVTKKICINRFFLIKCYSERPSVNVLMVTPVVIPAKARDYVFPGVGLSVCLSVCLFVCYHDN